MKRERTREKLVSNRGNVQGHFFLFFSFYFQERDDRWRLEGEGLRRDEKKGRPERKRESEKEGRGAAETPINLQPGVNHTGRGLGGLWGGGL